MKFLKRLFCRHENKRPDNRISYATGRAEVDYRTRCVDCGKVW